VTTLSDYLNENLPAGWQKPQLVEALSGALDRATVYRYLAGTHPRSPAEAVLQAFAAVLPGVTLVELRAAARLSAGAEEPWVPPIEANRLSHPQRRALEAFIRATVGPLEDVENTAAPDAIGSAVRAGSRTAEPLPAGRELTVRERAEVQSYLEQLYATGRHELADRVTAASLITEPAPRTADRSARD